MNDPATRAGKWLVDRSLWDEGMRGFFVRINATAGPDDMHRHVLAIESEAAFDLRETLGSMVNQFAYWSDSVGGFTTGGLSALEGAFEALGWEDPHPQPDMRCDEPGCMKQQCIGSPTPTGYRSMCSDHGFPFLADLR